MKILLILLTVSLIIITNSCLFNVDDSGRSGTYSYTAYDSTGIIVAKGQIELNFRDSTKISGEWNIQQVGNPDNIGPQIGMGKLEGFYAQNELIIELNPHNVDNNLQLIGEHKNSYLRGNWFYISFIGITNQGTFEAEKK